MLIRKVKRDGCSRISHEYNYILAHGCSSVGPHLGLVALPELHRKRMEVAIHVAFLGLGMVWVNAWDFG